MAVGITAKTGKARPLRLEKAGSSGLLATAVTRWQMEEWEPGDRWAAFGGRGTRDQQVLCPLPLPCPCPFPQ